MKKSLLLAFWGLIFTVNAKVLVISDIDDTIKQANSTGSVSIVWYFLKADPYKEMAKLYSEFEKHYKNQGEEVEFIYLSAAYDITFKQDEWLSKNGFPKGKTILRKVGDGKTYKYKYHNLEKILKAENKDDLELFLFGDNSDQDPKVYADIVKDLKIDNSNIFIRDVSTFATYWRGGWDIKRLPGVSYFFSEMDLLNSGQFYFTSSGLTTQIGSKYQNKNLIPEYTFKTLKKRIEKVECVKAGYSKCKKLSKKWALDLWNDYHNRL